LSRGQDIQGANASGRCLEGHHDAFLQSCFFGKPAKPREVAIRNRRGAFDHNRDLIPDDEVHFAAVARPPEGKPAIVVTVLLPGVKLAIDQMLQGATERRRARFDLDSTSEHVRKADVEQLELGV
jgi:hypothetical protein